MVFHSCCCSSDRLSMRKSQLACGAAEAVKGNRAKKPAPTKGRRMVWFKQIRQGKVFILLIDI